MEARGRPRLSVVIPAHDEATVVGRCLRRLAPLLDDGRAEVVVVANGCTDGTAAVARETRGVRVLELDLPSKPAALNAGDAAVSAFPRVYLDADIEVDADALCALGEALAGDDPLVASPRVRFELAGCPWPVRAYYRMYAELPYVRRGLVGLGLYALSRKGRARFEAFPPVTADDLFVQGHFAPAERVVLPDRTFTVHAPRSLASLLRVRTRSVRGARELNARQHAGSASAGRDTDGRTASSTRALAVLVLRRPGLLPAALVYVFVSAVARLRASFVDVRWERDVTTR